MAEVADLIIRGGVLYDGRGGSPVEGDVAIAGDTIAAVGDLRDWHGRDARAANGLAVAPGFVNMLSWATESLLEDGRAQSDIRQGVTLEVMGEGFSMGPLTEQMKEEGEAQTTARRRRKSSPRCSSSSSTRCARAQSGSPRRWSTRRRSTRRPTS